MLAEGMPAGVPSVAANLLVFSSLREDVKTGKCISETLSVTIFFNIHNSDDCRFPHILTDGPGTHNPPHFSGRSGGARPRGDHTNTNGFGTIEEKLGGVTLRDVSTAIHCQGLLTSTYDQDASRPQNGAEGSSRSHSTDPGGRPRFSQAIKNINGVNGARGDKRVTAKQRVPNADEFPVLAGSTTPPSRSSGPNGLLANGNGYYGPTAAQVLQAPPPVRRDSARESSTRGATPDPVRPVQPAKVEAPSRTVPHLADTLA